MILYHFTALENVEVIKRDGLRAALTGDSAALIGDGLPVVFLCDTPTCAATDAETKIFLQRQQRRRSADVTPVISKRWLKSYTDAPLARFTVRLPSSDYKLKHYGRWYRANCYRVDGLPRPEFMLSDILMRRALKTWWIYFDDIPPSKIAECTTEAAFPLQTQMTDTDDQRQPKRRPARPASVRILPCTEDTRCTPDQKRTARRTARRGRCL